MKRAILSDVHGNAEALAAVLDDIRREGVDEIYCLGDMVTCGPDPRECLERAMTWSVCLLGSDDLAVRHALEGRQTDERLSESYTREVAWAADQLRLGSPTDVERRRRFLKGLASTAKDGDVTYGHGSPHAPESEFLFPEDVYNHRKMKGVFDAVGRRAFHGRSHLPGIFTESGEFLTPEQCTGEYHFPGEKTIVSVGSVGQPRDGDPRACYVIAGDASARFRRVPYDLDETIRKLKRLA